MLHRDSVGVVAGTSGLGKTQTAIEYAHRFGASYPGGVYWVDAERGISALIIQVSESAALSIDTKAEEEKQVAQLWKELNKLPPCLLVLDNLPEEASLRAFLPTTGRIHTLVTTRRRDLTDFPNGRINVLSNEAGVALLNSGERKLNRDEAVRLTERLGCLPLAPEQAMLSRIGMLTLRPSKLDQALDLRYGKRRPVLVNVLKAVAHFEAVYNAVRQDARTAHNGPARNFPRNLLNQLASRPVDVPPVCLALPWSHLSS